jgi:uncharacterized protein (TIGR03083 family)
VGIRPLRQHYAGKGVAPLPTTRAVDLDPGLEPWRRHRARLLDELAALTPEEWEQPTRCEAWNVREVVGHLVVVDGWWTTTLTNARDRATPTTYLDGFDPSSSTDDMVAATTTLPVAELLARHRDATDALLAVAAPFDDADWDARNESPLGHLPARFSLGHAWWDSWLHEHDILEPLGRAPEVTADELLAMTWFSLWFAGLQGGIVDDPDAVGPGPDAPIRACLAFTDLPDVALHLEVGTLADGVHVARCAPDHAPIAAGRARTLVDGMSGRAPLAPVLDALPADVGGQVARAALVF